MPGLLIMNNSGADEATGPNEGGSLKRSHDGRLINGDLNSQSKSTAAPASPADGSTNTYGVNGTLTSAFVQFAHAAEQMAELPPEIMHLTSDFYHPFSKLLQRTCQESFNELNELLQAMAEIQVSQQSNGVLTNGVGGHVNGFVDNSEANRQKKLMILRFAQENRAKFIKLLVLAEWGKKSSGEIAKLVDIVTWAREQHQHMDQVDMQMQNLKDVLGNAKQPNPDIRTALEVLSTGKATWIPDLGFIPPEPMTAKNALALIRYLNTSLSIRLNVHENLPSHLRNWRINSGKVTFVVESEFELDLLSFTEDTSDQWHFIDLRLLFSPAPSIPTDARFLRLLKPRLDWILNQSQAGLCECYDFLHNFILTHKIATLKSQAYDLLQAGWAGSLKVEPVHRSLVIQYWTDRPGKKSWIEIGLSSNKPKNGKPSWRGPPVSSITVRWFRQGMEVKDIDLKFDWKNLSMEQMLKRVMALHVSFLLQIAREKISPKMTVKSSLSETEPWKCALEISLGTAENAIDVRVEPTTGRYSLRPLTPFSARAEHDLNSSKEPTPLGAIVTLLLSRNLHDLVYRHAQQLGWRPVNKYGLRLDVVKKAVQLDVLQYQLYRPHGWKKWTLAAIVDHSGESWWIVELGTTGANIEYAELMKSDTQHQKLINRDTLSGIVRLAVQQISFCVTIREFQARNIPFGFNSEVSLSAIARPAVRTQSALWGWVLRLSTTDLLVSRAKEHQWLGPGLCVTFHGFRSNYCNVWHVVSGTMVRSVARNMQKLMSGSQQDHFTFSENGTFAILLSTPFGEPIVDQLTARLREIDRLRSFASTLQRRKMLLKSSSLGRVEFQYSKQCTATVNFSDEKNITLNLNANNPHHRIHIFLTEIINGQSPKPPSLPLEDDNALDRFCSALLMTRPILYCLDELERENLNTTINPSIHVHDFGKYRIQYRNPLCSFDVRLKPKDNKVFWHIEDNERRPLNDRPTPERTPNLHRPESLKIALNTLYKSSGNCWYGLRASILAEVDGVPDALRALHKTVIGCAVEIPLGEQPSVHAINAPLVNSNGNSKPPSKVNTGRQGVNGKMKQEVIELD
ncbi:MED14-domain-containing protein [Lojkania enalia]|uniref:Mediator of RNA polymerase II transcription subunit 14 n=1 Tax=Lojkania enalia TaxID=147567 RepID=A0A9P4JW80_9PLEO|nr:MED14-domain-containing protein [Didymosphaeria enalia]